jgi:hypothetical protein
VIDDPGIDKQNIEATECVEYGLRDRRLALVPPVMRARLSLSRFITISLRAAKKDSL